MNAKRYIDTQIALIRRTVGDSKAVTALSGGVDSSVVTMLGHKALGSQLDTVFLDDGLMRQGEPMEIVRIFKSFAIPVRVLRVLDRFFTALKGIEDPEEKRKVFRTTFYQCLSEAVRASGARFLLQGTIKADIIETQKGVKTQHNILEPLGISPQKDYGFSVIEPLKDLFKPDVRTIAGALGLPPTITQRMPFPGPGLATRCLGEVTPERIAIVRKATSIVEQETSGVKAFQCLAVLMKDKATGVTRKGTRIYGHIIVVRCVDSQNAMTAQPVELPWKIMRTIEKRITSEIKGVARVLYDVTPKPPATIEFI